jgi:chloramphenicol-sensitive protein RarD
MGAALGDNRRARIGLACGVGAYTTWGLMPLMFNGIKGLGNFEILAIRIVISTLSLILLVTIARQWRAIARVVQTPRLLAGLAASAVMIVTNWLIYITAARGGHVMEASLGYFINPLFNVALGMLFLGERLRPIQWGAILLAAAGVIFLALNKGNALWVSLGLAGSFGLYGLIRKLLPVGPLEGLAVENLLCAPFAMLFLLVAPLSAAASYTPSNIALLALLGPMTVLPLFLFAAAAQRLSYSTVGLIQYIGPSLQFVIALWLGESFDMAQAFAFGCIWTALVIYAGEGLRHHVRANRELAPAK